MKGDSPTLRIVSDVNLACHTKGRNITMLGKIIPISAKYYYICKYNTRHVIRGAEREGEGYPNVS